MKKINLILILILFLVSCQPTGTEQTIIVENKYSLTIPSFLTKVSNLNEDASLQYQHAWKEFYVIVIDESREEFRKALYDNDLDETYSIDIKGYSDLLLDVFTSTMTINNKTELKDTIIDNFPARTIQITARTEGVDVYFSLAFVEGNKRYYQIMAWTLSNKKYQYDYKMGKLINSFKEL